MGPVPWFTHVGTEAQRGRPSPKDTQSQGYGLFPLYRWFSNLSGQLSRLEKQEKAQILGPAPSVSDSEICISNALPAMPLVLVWGDLTVGTTALHRPAGLKIEVNSEKWG